MDDDTEDRSAGEVPVTENSSNEPEQGHTTADYAKYSPPSKPPNQLKRWLIWGLILAVIFAALVVGYEMFKKPKTRKNGTTSDQTSQSQTTASQTPITATKNYASQNFALSFDYPNDWTVTDVGGGIMIVKSPGMSLTNASGQPVKTIISLSFRNKTYKLGEFDAGNALAERDSTKIAYTKPTQSQRGDTYISFLRYAKSTSGLDEICVTGNNGYKASQAIPAVDLAKVDPVVCISFTTDVGNTKQPTQGVTVASSVWDNPSFSTPLVNILKSLVIQ